MGWNIDLPAAEWFTMNSPAYKLEALINEVIAQPHVAIDTETTGLNVVKDIPLYWSLSWGERRIAMPAVLMHKFKPAFADSKKHWIYANAKFDRHMQAQIGIEVAGKLVDIQVMHALIYEEQPHGLKHIAKSILGWGWRDFFDTFEPLKILEDIKEDDEDEDAWTIVHMDTEEVLKRKTHKKRRPKFHKEAIGEMLQRFERDNLEALVEYASMDAYGTFKGYLKLKEQLEAEATWSLYPDLYPNMWEVFYKTEVPFTKVLWKCERNGLLIDTDYIAKIRKPVEDGIAKLERDIAKAAGRVMNLNSRDELAAYFFDEKGHKSTKLTKGGKTGIKKKALDAAVLENLALVDPVAKMMLELRDLTKMHGTYVVGLSKHLDQYNRIHCRLNQDVARCMPAGELVLTSRGYLPVEQVIVGDQVITHTGKTRHVVERSTHEPKPIYNVRLSNGLELRTTGNHQYRVKDGWVRADALSLGDPVTVHSETEEWRTIPCWDEFEVSSWGRVRNRATQRVRVLYPHGKWGHLKVTLTRNGAQARGENKKDLKVHRLVLSAFGTGAGEVRHLNGIAWDNTIQNLRYGTGRRWRDEDYIEGSYASFYEASVIAITLESPEVTYGLTVENDHSHVTGGVVTHNTGRLSSSNPNLQNIPKPDTDKFKIRGAFCAPEGYVLIVLDYDQLEMRLLAAAAMEPDMIALFKSGKDIHMGNAEFVLGPIYERKYGKALVYDDMANAKKLKKKDPDALTEWDHKCLFARDAIKAVCYGLNYGMKSKKLAGNLGVSVEEAEEVIKAYMDRYPTVANFYKSSIDTCRETLKAFTLLGRRRFLPEIQGHNTYERWQAERQATNTVIQGTAADAARCAMIACDEAELDYHYGAEMLLQVHDELIFQCPAETAKQAHGEIKEFMEHPFPTDLEVELTCGGGIGPSWNDAK